jgi:carbon-monoxide dehydrogenase large subunit
MDYAIPRATTDVRVRNDDGRIEPVPDQSDGHEGVGELGTIGATPAVVNAVVDALARNGFAEGARTLQMPLDAEQVWRAMQR